jgi:tripartite-type tricarboxylate transporter receptor subunit TctC
MTIAGMVWLTRGGFHCLLVRAIIAIAIQVTGAARADDGVWPNKQITVLVGFAAGGNTDLMARMAAQRLSERLKQTVIIENKPGASGSFAASFVSQAAPDGYTLLFAASPQIGIVPFLQKVNYDPLKDFVPVSSIGSGPSVLAIRSPIPARSITEFIEYARQKPITYGSGGVGTISHLLSALFISRAGINGVHVPFRGSALTTTAVLGGQIDMDFANASDVMPYAEDKRINLPAVTAEKRLRQLPNVPIIAESSANSHIPNTGLPSWNGFFSPAATPAPIVQKLAVQLMAIAKEPDIIARLEQNGIVAEGTSPEEFKIAIKSDLALFAAAIKAAGVQAAN